MSVVLVFYTRKQNKSCGKLAGLRYAYFTEIIGKQKFFLLYVERGNAHKSSNIFSDVLKVHSK